MIAAIAILTLAFYWLLRETRYFQVRLLVGMPVPEETPLELERLSWGVCNSRYGDIKLSPGIDSPLCGLQWLEENTHPIPQAIIDMEAGGVRYHINIKDTVVLKDVLAAMKYKKPKSNGHLRFTRNKYGGLVAPLPPKVRS